MRWIDVERYTLTLAAHTSTHAPMAAYTRTTTAAEPKIAGKATQVTTVAVAAVNNSNTIAAIRDS